MLMKIDLGDSDHDESDETYGHENRGSAKGKSSISARCSSTNYNSLSNDANQKAKLDESELNIAFKKELFLSSECELDNYLNERIKRVELNKQTEMQCFISHIESPSEFYLQVSSEKIEIFLIYDLEEQLQNIYESNQFIDWKMPNLSSPNQLIGSEWACLYALDFRWYRVKVIEVLKTISSHLSNYDSCKLEVLYLDFGNRETVMIKDLRPLLPQFFDVPTN
ncbi:RING finger protein 17-like protein [Dinothrombium tinctorium]|uniref:RING finger protein 17-like protein n=1 Tax=Dinothrombium tinctorium TaxID=1965070 RepID=A0A3S3NDL2_9ACAR|nr:RING finger protein 17-like protein [Dinothrombium tinctorium]